jgi:diketogulonate reductase-like aldo/keto reductase
MASRSSPTAPSSAGGFITRQPGGCALAEIAGARGATPHQGTLAFLTRRPSIFAIPKAAPMVHAENNAVARRVAVTRTAATSAFARSRQKADRQQSANLGRRPIHPASSKAVIHLGSVNV